MAGISQLSTVPNAGLPAGMKKAQDAGEQKTLYVHRPLKNSDVIREWAKASGFKITLPPEDMHATIAFSKTPIDWSKFSPDAKTVVELEGGMDRKIEVLGDKGAIVLRFDSPALRSRHEEFRDGGASWDHDGYRPHVTISYDAGNIDLSKVTPYYGPLEFGPEVFEEVNPKWIESIKEKSVSSDSVDFILRHKTVLAFDRASVRYDDTDGRMHVEETNVCKACISPYKGSEIPDYEGLGLDPEKIYQMLRPPEELERAVKSANGLQLLRKHIPVSADDHKPYDVVGAMGTTARWESPYIKNGLTIWSADDIEAVKKKKKYELSPGYRYIALMEPGNFEGQIYDGKMIDIVFNHWAIVEEGRQGPDVLIGDGLLELEWAIVEDAVAKMVRAA